MTAPTLLQRFTEWLQKRATRFLTLWFLLFAAVSQVAAPGSLLWAGLFLLAAALLLEPCLRLLLRAAYGPNYRNSYTMIALRDRSDYGYSLTPSFRARNVAGPVFDKYLFPAGQPRILDPDRNCEARLEYSTNSLGFRGPEFTPEKTDPETIRIFCSGGSTTAGSSLNDDEAWPAQLEILLRADGVKAEVINAGVFGWSSFEELYRLRGEIVGYGPDVVLLHQGWNDEFLYSSLQLGKNWRPGLVRTARETNNFYCPPGRVLGDPDLPSFYLLNQAWWRERVFASRMSFTNPDRWLTLLHPEHLLGWFDNLLASAGLARKHGFLLYTLDYPGLTSLSDSPGARDHYVAHSRLTHHYAEYQAISKNRISRFLTQTQALVPCLNTEPYFTSFTKDERLSLFSDEIHMTAKGNVLLAESIHKRLMADPAFSARLEGNPAENVRADADAAATREALSKNSKYIERLVLNKVDELRTGKVRAGSSDIPTDMYTTF